MSRSAKDRAQKRGALSSRLSWVNEVARGDKQARFTSLLHHVDEAALERSFRGLRRNASAGVDGETVASYEEDLQSKLQDLCERVHTGRYRAQPVRRVYISKSNGGRRPLGIPALEDKIVQGAVSEVLNAIYEADFLGFSYGFRPKRSPHDALAALHQAVMTQRVNWVLDADIRSFFDSVDHEWLLRMIAHRVADRRVQRLIRKWLKAGVMEKGERTRVEQGTAQGSAISPLLANIFLHYVLDLWVHQWRRRSARGRVSIVRYCDDFVMGFEFESDARRMLRDLQARLAKFGLALHEGKTRLLEFGRLCAIRRARRGERRPETFTFLGFTHYCGWTRKGRFIMKHKTQRERLTRKLRQLRFEARRRMHLPVAEQQRWLSQVLRGHYAYYGISGNSRTLSKFYWQVLTLWCRSLRRRSQRGLTWARFAQMLKRFPLPNPRLNSSWMPRLVALGYPSGGAQCGKSARWDL